MTPATKALDRAGIPYRLHSYENHAANGYAQEASILLNLPSDQVFKTLIVTCGKHYFGVALIPSSHQLDLKAFAKASQQKKAVMAEQTDAERLTGYLKGGISPIGQKTQLPTLVDDSILQLDSVFVSGGKRGLEIELSPVNLIAFIMAQVHNLCRTGSSSRSKQLEETTP